MGGEKEEGGSLQRWEQMGREVIPSDARGFQPDSARPLLFTLEPLPVGLRPGWLGQAKQSRNKRTIFLSAALMEPETIHQNQDIHLHRPVGCSSPGPAETFFLPTMHQESSKSFSVPGVQVGSVLFANDLQELRPLSTGGLPIATSEFLCDFAEF